MSESKDIVKVEECIQRRACGTYYVRVRGGGGEQRGTFKTLTEARTFRDKVIKGRPPRDRRDGRPGHSGDNTSYRESVRQILAKSPRTTIERDGRQWTLVSLPPATRGAT
jgi:hypothetical protein